MRKKNHNVILLLALAVLLAVQPFGMSAAEIAPVGEPIAPVSEPIEPATSSPPAIEPVTRPIEPVTAPEPAPAPAPAPAPVEPSEGDYIEPVTEGPPAPGEPKPAETLPPAKEKPAAKGEAPGKTAPKAPAEKAPAPAPGDPKASSETAPGGTPGTPKAPAAPPVPKETTVVPVTPILPTELTVFPQSTDTADLYLDFKGDYSRNMLESGRVVLSAFGEKILEAPIEGKNLDIRGLLRGHYTVSLIYKDIQGTERRTEEEADLTDETLAGFTLSVPTGLRTTEEGDELYIKPMYYEEIYLPKTQKKEEDATLQMDSFLRDGDLILQVREISDTLKEPFYLNLALPGEEPVKVAAEKPREGLPWVIEYRIPLEEIRDNTYHLTLCRKEITEDTKEDHTVSFDYEVEKVERPQCSPRASLVLDFAGDLKEAYLSNARLILKRNGEEDLETTLRDLTPITFHDLERDVYTVEFRYTNEVGEEVVSTTAADLTGFDDVVYETVSTNLLVLDGVEYYTDSLVKKDQPVLDDEGNTVAKMDLRATRVGKDLSLEVTEKDPWEDKGFFIKEIGDEGKVLRSVEGGLTFPVDAPEDPSHGEMTLPLEAGTKNVVIEKETPNGPAKAETPIVFNVMGAQDTPVLTGVKVEEMVDPVKEWKKGQVEFLEEIHLPNLPEDQTPGETTEEN